MKRTCYGCKALSKSFSHDRYWDCELDYKQDGMKCIPLEECPKPNTISKFVLLKLNNNH